MREMAKLYHKLCHKMSEACIMLENNTTYTKCVYPTKKILSDQNKVSLKKYPTYLYMRGELFYYRRRIPKKYQFRNENIEIRFSLQTDSFREAKQKATFMTTTLHTLFKEKGIVTPEDMAKIKLFCEQEYPQFVSPQKPLEYPKTILDIHAWLIKHGHDYTLDEVANILYLEHPLPPFPDFLSEKLNKILDGKDKVQLAYDEISKRLTGYFKYLLNCDAQKSDLRTLYENRELPQALLGMKTPKQIGITTKSMYSSFLTHHKSIINNPPLLCLFCLEFFEKLIELGVFRIEEFSYDSYLTIANEYCKISVEFLSILQARLKKDYSKEKSFFAFPCTSYSENAYQNIIKDIVTSQPVQDNKNKNLLAFLDNYLTIKVQDGKKDPRYIPELKRQIELFAHMLTDKPIDDYTRKDFRDFRDNLKKLPPNFSKLKVLKGKSIQEILDMQHANTLGANTINGYLVDISAFFNWLVIEGFLVKNHATGLTIKERQSEIDLREPFSNDDIRIIFKSNELKAFKESKKPSRYWVPWIGLYTGMRVEEICQLHCADIYEVEKNLWVIDVNENPGQDAENTKHLKTLNANRIIPIHNHLKEIGLLKYLETIKKDSERLFPDLRSLSVRKQYAKMMSKDFGPFVRKLGITGTKSFHSLRHSFSDCFKEQLLHTTIFEQVFGHSHEKLATRRYGDRFTPEQCYEKLIKLLDYGLQ